MLGLSDHYKISSYSEILDVELHINVISLMIN